MWSSCSRALIDGDESAAPPLFFRIPAQSPPGGVGRMSAPLSARYRTAFITGAGAGLGLAFTEMLLGEGVEVWGTSRDPARLPSRPKFHALRLELGDGTAAERIFVEAERAAGGFDLVINNAGFGAFGSFAHTDFAVWEEQF